MVITQELPRLLQPPRQSFFLFGPRGSGKSTWIRQRFPKALRFDRCSFGFRAFVRLRCGAVRFAE